MREKRRSQEDVPPLLVLMTLAAGAIGYWLFVTPAAERLAMLETLGYGPPPLALKEQFEWLLEHRMKELEGAVRLLVLGACCGLVEGHAHRESSLFSGFGLRQVVLGRALLAAWIVGVLAAVLTPVMWSYEWVAAALAGLLGVSLHILARGRSRAH